MRLPDNLKALIACTVLLPLPALAQNAITTVVGGRPSNVPANAASIGSPIGAVRDSHGTTYIAESNLIYKVDSTGMLSLFAGGSGYGTGGDGGAALDAQFRSIVALATDGAGDLFIVDNQACMVREVLAATGKVNTVAGNGTCTELAGDGPATSIGMGMVSGAAVDLSGNVYISESDTCRLREVQAASENLVTIAGNGSCAYAGDGGPANLATLVGPHSVAVDMAGNLYIADGNFIREIAATTSGTMTAGYIYTIAGNGSSGLTGDNGPATSASLGQPMGVFVDGNGNVFIADTTNEVIREIAGTNNSSVTAGYIYRVAGTGAQAYGGDGGVATNASLSSPQSVFVDGDGNVVLADMGNHRVRQIAGKSAGTVGAGEIYTFAGNGYIAYSGDGGPAVGASINEPYGMAIDGLGNLYIADTFNQVIREVSASDEKIRTIAGTGAFGYSGDGGPATLAKLNFPYRVTLDHSGNLFIADASNCVIRKVAVETGVITTVAGNGICAFNGDNLPATSAALNDPYGLIVDDAGNLYIADTANFRIREVPSTTSGTMTAGYMYTIAGTNFAPTIGDNGPATSAMLYFPLGIAMDKDGNLFIADTYNGRIREVAAKTTSTMTAGYIYTVAGNGTSGPTGDNGPALSAALYYPSDVQVDATGDLFIADTYLNSVREVPANSSGTMTAGYIYTVAGTGTPGYSGDGGPAASAMLSGPRALAAGPGGDLLIVDTDNGAIRSVAGLLSNPWLSVGVSGLSLGVQVVGTVSAAKTITVTNSGTAPLNVSGVDLSGTNASDFAQTNTCGSAVQPAASCTVSVTFKPIAAGSRMASIVITGDGTGGPETVSATGTGVTFALVASTSSQTVNAGQTATYSLQLTTAGGGPSDEIQATVTCSGAPSGTPCVATPSTVSATSASPGTFTISVGTGGSAAAFGKISRPPRHREEARIEALLPGTMLLIALIAMGILAMRGQSGLTNSRLPRLAAGVLLMLAPIGSAVWLSGCSGGSSAPKGGTYTLTVTATVEGSAQTATLTLIVN
jgi:sugar lactone lactonase YvrE